MTELSRPWGGIVTGDAGPYTDDHWADVWERFLGALAQANLGVLKDVANELEVTGVATPLSVNTGVALNNGVFYINDAAVNVVVAAPAAANRIDRVVLRKDWALQTVRITLIGGVEGAGVPPALVQVDGTTWDMPLYQSEIAFPGNAITLIDERRFVHAGNPAHRKLQPPLVRWTLPGWYWGAQTSQVVVANRIYYTPIYVEEYTNYIRIGCDVVVGDGAGGTCDMRIFQFENGIPTRQLYSFGTVNTNAAGLKEIVIDINLDPGWYFIACLYDQTPTMQVPDLAQAVASPIASLALTGNMASYNVILYEDGAYADPAGAIDGFLGVNFLHPTLREN